MTSMPASRKARAMIFAPRSWPSRPGFAMTTLIFRATACEVYGGGVGGSVRRAVEPEAPLASFIQVARLGSAVTLSLRAGRADGDSRHSPFRQCCFRKAQEFRERAQWPQDHVGGLAGTVGSRKTYLRDRLQVQHARTGTRDA